MGARLHPHVDRIGRSFRVVGMGTPATVELKTNLLLTPAAAGERVAVVAADVIRCSTTIVTLLAGGAAGIVVRQKSGAGVTPEQAQILATGLGRRLLLAGELNGLPIPGGVVGNSPREAALVDVDGTLISFASTNFGATFNALIDWRRAFEAAGGQASIVVATLANRARVSAWLTSGGFDRIAFALGGFYDVLSIEDALLAGDVIGDLDRPLDQLDDEARMMLAASRGIATASERVAMLHSNWIGQALAEFGMADDIAAVVTGDHLPRGRWLAMSAQLPIVTDLNGFPVIVPTKREEY